MHELSVAQSLVELIEDELAAGAAAQPRGTVTPHCPRVGRVRVRVGALSGVVPEALASAFPVAVARSAFRGATLSIEECPVVAWCPACGTERVLPSPQRLRCPACGGPTPDVLAGRELELVSIEVLDDDTDAHDNGGTTTTAALTKGTPTTTAAAPAATTPTLPPPPRILEVRTQILKKNDVTARDLRARFRSAGVFVTSLVSSPGAGKTTFLRELLKRVGQTSRVAALVGDLATENDARRLAEAGVPVRQIVTGTVCHLEADMVERALADWRLADLDHLFVENVGNLVCPASYDLGEDLRLVLLSTTEGEDKPLKYPTIFNTADVAILTKIDLTEAVGFDRAAALASIDSVRPGMRVFEVSAKTGAGVDDFLAFLEAEVATRRDRPATGAEREPAGGNPAAGSLRRPRTEGSDAPRGAEPGRGHAL